MPDDPVIEQMRQQDAAAAQASSYGVSPGAARDAVNNQPVTGVPASAAMHAPQQSNDTAHYIKNSGILLSSPPVQAFVGKSPAHAAATGDALQSLKDIAGAVGNYFTAGGTFYNDFTGAPSAAISHLSADIGQGAREAYPGQHLVDIAAVPLSLVGGLFHAALAPPSRAIGSINIPAQDPLTGRPLTTAPERSAAVENALSLGLLGLGETLPGRGLISAADATKGFVPREGPLPGGTPAAGAPSYTVAGHVADDLGLGATFPDLRSAGRWITENGLARDHIPEEAPDGSYFVKRVERPDIPQPGTSPEADAFHATAADTIAESVKEVEDKVAASPLHESVPTLTREFLGDNTQGQFAYVPLAAAAKIAQRHGLDAIPRWASDAPWNPTTQEYKVPLADYISSAAGQPWADELRQATRFSDSGVSQEEAKANLETRQVGAEKGNAFETAITSYGRGEASAEQIESLPRAAEWAAQNKPELLPGLLQAAKSEQQFLQQHIEGAGEESVQAAGAFVNHIQSLMTAAPATGVPESIANWTKVGEKPGGSNPGAVYEDQQGVKWLVKGSNHPNPEVSKNEVLAAQLLKATGNPAPDMKLVDLGQEHGGGLGVASRFEEGMKPADVKNPAHANAMRQQFAAHAWLSNRDVVGDWDPNIFQRTNGEVVSIDPGGALRYRGSGVLKSDFSSEPIEWESMRNPQYPSQHAWFGGMSERELKDSALPLETMQDSTIAKYVHASGVENPEEMIKTLEDRRDAILKKAGLKPAVSEPMATPVKLPDDIPEEARQYVEANLTQAQPVIEQALQSLWLHQILTGPEALSMTKGQFALYSQQLQVAKAKIEEAVAKRIYNQVWKYRSKEFKTSYEKHYPQVVQSIMSSPPVQAYHALKYGTPQAVDIMKDNALVKGGKPITWYHGSNYTDIHSWGFGPFSNHKVISFSSDPKFASEWAEGKGTIGGTSHRPVVYITYIKAKNPADYEKPADVEKAAQWLVKQQGGGIEYYRYALKKGEWSLWENPKMWKALGWDAAHMKEGEFSPSKNISVANGDQIYFKYAENNLPARLRLDPAVRDWTPQSVLDRLPSGIFEKGGADADEIAEQTGFENGQHMLSELAKFEDARKASGESFKNYLLSQYKAGAIRRAETELGYNLSKEDILQAAQEAASLSATDFLIGQLRDIAKESGDPVSREDIENTALANFGRMDVFEAINIPRLVKQIAKAGRDTERALEKGDWKSAFEGKQRQVIQHLMLREAFEFKKLYDRQEAKLSRWAKLPVKKNVDQPYWNQILQMLLQTGHTLGKRVNPDELVAQLLKRGTNGRPESHEAFIQKKMLEGHNELYDGLFPQRSVRDMSTDEYREFKKTIDSIYNMGRSEKEILVGKERMRVEDLVNTAVANIRGKGIKFKLEDISKGPTGTVGEKVKEFGKGAGGALREIENLFLRMERFLSDADNDDPAGPLNTVFRVLSDSKHLADNLTKDAIKDLQVFYKAAGKGWAKRMKQKVHLPELSFTDEEGINHQVIQTFGDLASVIEHLGNAENESVLLRGMNWDPAVLNQALDKHTTEADWDHAQLIWTQHEKIWPLVEKLYREVVGVAPPKIQPRPFERFGKQYTGGYARLQYNTFLSHIQNAMFGEKSLMGPEYQSALPGNGYVHARTGFVGPLQLGMDTSLNRLAQIIHDVSYRKALIDAEKVLLHPRLLAAIDAHYGPQYSRQLRPWLEYIARQNVFNEIATKGVANWLRGFRANATAVGLAYRLTSPLKHFGPALANSVSQVGAESFAEAFRDIRMSPGTTAYWHQFVFDHSDEMRQRAQNLDRDIRLNAMRLMQRQGGLMQEWQKYMFHFLYLSDQFSAMPTWLAAYRNQMAKANDPDLAMFAADQAVRLAHGAAAPLDLPPYLRTGGTAMHELGALTSVFTGFLNVAWNRLWKMGRLMETAGTKSKYGDWAGATRDWSKAASMGIYSVIITGIIGTAVQTLLDRGKQRPWWESAIFGVLHQQLGGIPVLNGFIGALEGYEQHSPITDVEQILTDLGKIGINAAQMTGLIESKVHHSRRSQQSEVHLIPHRFAQDMINTPGYFGGPTGFGQPLETGEYLWGLMTGTEHPENMADVMSGMISGPKPQKTFHRS